MRLCVVVPGADYHRRSGALQPLLKEPAEVRARRFLGHSAEILGGRVCVLVAAVILANGGPEVIIAQLGAQHVQRPCAFFVDGAVGDLLHVRQVVVNDGHLRQFEDGIAAFVQAGHEGVAAFVMLGVQQREVGGEAFAQPDIIPVFLGNRIAKPVMRNFVRHQVGGGMVGDCVFAVKNSRGMFRAAMQTGDLHIGQLFIGIGSDGAAEKLHGIARGLVERGDAFVAVLMVDPGFERHSRRRAEVTRRVWRDGNGVQPRSDGH